MRKRSIRPILLLAWPAALEMLFQSCVSYADTAMVGRLGAEASAAVGLTTSVQWLLGCVLSAAGIGCVACISRADGAGEKEKMRIASVQSLWLVLGMGSILTFLVVLVHKALPGWMNAGEEIRAAAGQYFLIASLPLLFRASTIIFGAVLRGAGDTRTPMLNNVTINVINVVLNFFLIYPSRTWNVMGRELFVPGAGLGINGAAAATAIAQTIGGILMLRSVWKCPAVTPSGIPLRPDRPVLKEILQVGCPVMTQRIINCLGYITFAALVASLGTVSLAANSIATSAEELFYVAGYGIQAATTTLAGNALGEGDREKFRWVTRTTTILTASILTASGCLLFLFAAQIMSIFTADAAVIAMGAVVLRVVAVSEPAYGVLITLEGVFNGIGDTTAPVVYSLVTMWGVRILFTAVCVYVLHLGLTAVWCCMVADNVLRTVLLSQRYLRKKWEYRFG